MGELKITKSDSKSIEWLMQNENNALDSSRLSDVVKIIINKHNRLVNEIKSELKQ